MKPSHSQFHTIRNLRYHVRCWGEAGAPQLFLLHGWMDVSASFQFLVDSFARDWQVIAPDWRGFGLSEWARDGYWFPDYYADLDALLEIYQPDTAVNLLGHSMGGNVACTYAGIRPQRVAKLVSLEGFGASRMQAGEAPQRRMRVDLGAVEAQLVLAGEERVSVREDLAPAAQRIFGDDLVRHGHEECEGRGAERAGDCFCRSAQLAQPGPGPEGRQARR